MQTEIADIIVPAQFTAYQVENSVVSTEFFQSGVVAKNGLIADQLAAGATSFTVPFWKDIPDVEADITNDDPTILSTPQKITAGKQTVRKSFLHGSWSHAKAPPSDFLLICAPASLPGRRAAWIKWPACPSPWLHPKLTSVRSRAGS